MVGKAHQMWRESCSCGNCSYCNGISYPAQRAAEIQRNRLVPEDLAPKAPAMEMPPSPLDVDTTKWEKTLHDAQRAQRAQGSPDTSQPVYPPSTPDSP